MNVKLIEKADKIDDMPVDMVCVMQFTQMQSFQIDRL